MALEKIINTDSLNSGKEKINKVFDIFNNGAIDPTMTTFFKMTSKNLFDPSKETTETYLNSNGMLTTLTGYSISGIIWCLPNINYSFTKVRVVSWYDSSGNHIRQDSGNPITLLSPANSAYMRIGYTSTNREQIQVERGSTPTFYEPYAFTIPKEMIETPEIDAASIPINSIDATKTNFIEVSKNIVNVEIMKPGYYVYQSDGLLLANELYSYQDYTLVEPNTDYVASGTLHTLRIAFYNKDKRFISGLLAPTNFKTPANAAYIRFSSYTTYINTLQIEKGTVATNYEPYGLTIPGLKVALNEEVDNPKIVLPPKIYVVAGEEMNLYFDNVFNRRDVDYDFDVTCTVGEQYQDFLRIKTMKLGTYPLTIQAIKNGVIVATATSSVIVTAKSVGSGINKKVLILGDSTTDSGYAVARLMENFDSDVMDITTLGTRSDSIIGTNGNTYVANHEGRSGWTAELYFTSDNFRNEEPNPFFNNGTFDFANYMIGKTTPDYFIINLGINDTFSFIDDNSLQAKIPEIIGRINTIIQQIKNYDLTIKIGIAVTIPPNYSQDAFAKAYKNTQTRARYKRNNFIFTEEVINTFKGKETENIYLIPINVALDTKNNMGFEEQKVNSRNNKMVQSPIASGGVHPAPEGYHQIADVYYAFLKSFES